MPCVMSSIRACAARNHRSRFVSHRLFSGHCAVILLSQRRGGLALWVSGRLSAQLRRLFRDGPQGRRRGTISRSPPDVWLSLSPIPQHLLLMARELPYERQVLSMVFGKADTGYGIRLWKTSRPWPGRLHTYRARRRHPLHLMTLQGTCKPRQAVNTMESLELRALQSYTLRYSPVKQHIVVLSFA